MENKMYTTPKYKCGVCSTVYDSIEDRMNCEQTCIAKQKVEAKRVAEEKRKAEQEARKAELDMAIENVIKLKNAYIKDYGSYRYSYEPQFKPNEPDDFLPLKFGQI